MFYTYSQNNSGGSFIVNENVGQFVIIEADSPGQADEVAESRAGIYFDGCNNGQDCSCCGDRWYRQYSDDGSDEPMVYDKTIEDFKQDPGMIALRKEMCIHIYYQDGRHDKVAFDVVKAIEKKKAKQRKAAKKLWGNVFSFVRGVTNKNPIRLYQHESWSGEFTDEYYDKSGNRSMREGVEINHDFGWLSFASPNKAEVVEFMSGARDVLEEVREAVRHLESYEANNNGPKGAGIRAVSKLFLGKKE